MMNIFLCLNWFRFYRIGTDNLILALAHTAFSHLRILLNSSSDLCFNNNRCYSGHTFFTMGTGRVCIIIICSNMRKCHKWQMYHQNHIGIHNIILVRRWNALFINKTAAGKRTQQPREKKCIIILHIMNGRYLYDMYVKKYDR